MRALVPHSAVLPLTLLAFAASIEAQTPATPSPDVVASSAGDVRIERLATLEYPWGMAVLPDGRLLITEKPGRLRIWENGRLSAPVQGAPSVVYRGPPFEQGGLLDVEADPDFASNRLVCLSYVEADPMFYSGAMFPAWRGSALAGGLSSQSLIRLQLDGERVGVEERLFMGRRIRDVAQAPDGAILLIVDDRNGDLLRLTPSARPR